ncbi:FecR family protein [Emticicia sp. SJ17W-69]|uniref:FecR family protein n=1 Tax=Emticicia sp. SJ17W-69 TaxID=3421657 RepID=UPI003EC0DAB7
MKSKSVRYTVRVTVDDLLLDESFLNYYYRKDEADILEWEDWAELQPERQDLVREACLLLDKLSLKWNREQIEAKFNILNGKIELLLEEENPSLQISYRRPIRWVAAASVILLLSIGWWYFNQDDGKSHIYKELVANVSVPLIEKENNADKPLLVTLNDGSSILLQKGSRLSYPINFTEEKREVYLDGEAFFEVAKDPKRPFFVFANELVTKVLGTSFNIKSYKGQKDIEVVVRTGKVSVFRLDEIKNSIQLNGNQSKSVEGVVIVPNQQISFDKKKSNFSKSLVEQPEMLSEMPSYNFEFKDVSAAKVFATIQKAYGISIVYDEEILKECPVTASLSDEPLYGKLELVCNAIEAQYQLIDGQVVINSKGCKN